MDDQDFAAAAAPDCGDDCGDRCSAMEAAADAADRMGFSCAGGQPNLLQLRHREFVPLAATNSQSWALAEHLNKPFSSPDDLLEEITNWSKANSPPKHIKYLLTAVRQNSEVSPKFSGDADVLIRTMFCAGDDDPVAAVAQHCDATRVSLVARACALFTCLVVASLARGVPLTPDIVAFPFDSAKKGLSGVRYDEFLKAVSVRALDDIESWWSGAAAATGGFMWALRGLLAARASGQRPNFNRMIRDLAVRGGDSASNCAIVGALLSVCDCEPEYSD